VSTPRDLLDSIRCILNEKPDDDVRVMIAINDAFDHWGWICCAADATPKPDGIFGRHRLDRALVRTGKN